MGQPKMKKNQKKNNAKVSYKKSGSGALTSKGAWKSIAVEIEAESPLHLNSGRANVNIDSDIVHDAFGIPYFPAKRLRGLLYESAVELWEMMEGTNKEFSSQLIEELFNRTENSPVQMMIHDFYLAAGADYQKMADGWAYLSEKYPEIITQESVLKQYTSTRFRTRIDPETGTAADMSLRNVRVLDAGTKFYGKIELLGANEQHRALLELALCNLTRAGMNRNRGLGHIRCCSDAKKKGNPDVASMLKKLREVNQ